MVEHWTPNREVPCRLDPLLSKAHYNSRVMYWFILRFRPTWLKKIDSDVKHTLSFLFEPRRGKTNNVVSEQVRQKPACTSTEKS